MDIMLKLLLKIPIGIFSVLITLGVLYLCLAPQPIKDPGIFYFEGADKVVHFLMFFALTLSYLFDYWKIVYPHRPKAKKTIAISVAAIVLGGIIEFLQEYMNLGRSMDATDLFADSVGVVCATLIMYFYAFKKLR